MSRLALVSALCVVFVSGVLSSSRLPAQSPPSPWNRKFEAVSVNPAPGARPGIYEIQPFFTVEAGATTAPLNLSTRVDVLVNGKIIKSLAFSIFADPAAVAGCNVPCHEQGQVCVCVEGVLCSCGTVLVCDPPFPSALRPGDEITILLGPMPGALPEPDGEVERYTFVFEGNAQTWDRRIGGLRLTPQRGDTVDLEVAVDAFASYVGHLRLDAEVEVLVNGKPAQAAPVAADDFVWASCSPGCASSACGKGSGGGTGQCQQEIQEYGTFCWCAAADWGVVHFTGLEAVPGDEIRVILRPAPGALPDKMGDEGADERTIVVPGSRPVGHRKVEGLSVIPIPGAPRGHFQVQMYFSVEAPTTPSPLDLSTEAELLVNGKPIQTTRHRITADPNGAAGCVVPCHELGKVCVCVDGLLCGCGTILVEVPPTAAELSPADEIAVVLRPTDGAAPNADGLDVHHALIFEGDRLGWDRRIAGARVLPGRGDTVDLEVAVDAFASYTGQLRLDAELEVLINGKPVQHAPAAAEDFVWASCSPSCSSSSCGGDAGRCQEEVQEYGTFCWCAAADWSVVRFTGLEVAPGDEVRVILQPAMSGLPDTLGKGEDEHVLVIPGGASEHPFRRGDVNGDADVDMGDAVAALGWLFLGTRAPACADAADIDDDGGIGIGDPIGLLNWLFLGAAPPRRPGPFECGQDPTEDRLPACDYGPCLLVK